MFGLWTNGAPVQVVKAWFGTGLGSGTQKAQAAGVVRVDAPVSGGAVSVLSTAEKPAECQALMLSPH